MKILGISSFQTAAALIDGSEVVAAAEEKILKNKT